MIHVMTAKRRIVPLHLGIGVQPCCADESAAECPLLIAGAMRIGTGHALQMKMNLIIPHASQAG